MAWVFAAGQAVAGASGQYKAGAAASNTAAQNKQIGLMQADDALQQGTYDENRYRRGLKGFMGQQRAAIGANNVRQSGSPLRLLQDSAKIGEEDALNIRNNAALEAWGYKVGADQAGVRARRAQEAGTYNAAGTLLGGGADAYGKWSFNNRGG